MNQKEIREIKKRLKPEHQNISNLYGCYVTDKGEIIASFCESLNLISQDEQEKYLGVLKKVLSGSLEKNLRNLSFRTEQVVSGEECKLLRDLRDSQLKDEETRNSYFSKVISSIQMDSNYLILIACDAYDVPFKGKDGILQDDHSDTVFRYILSAVCPVKMTKAQMTYIPDEQCFRNRGTDFVIEAPELGFMYPAFDDRAANLYGVLYYTKSTKDSSDSFVDTMFALNAPMPAQTQKESFYRILEHSLGEDCNLENCVAIQTNILTRIEANKETHDPNAPVISKQEIADILEEKEIDEEKIAAFNVSFDEEFGTGSAIGAKNIVSAKKMELVAPDVVIKVNPERTDLVETKTINGSHYLVIRIDEGVTYNGVDLKFPE